MQPFYLGNEGLAGVRALCFERGQRLCLKGTTVLLGSFLELGNDAFGHIAN